MAKTKLDYIAEGRASFATMLKLAVVGTAPSMPAYGEQQTWQAKAFAQGWTMAEEEHTQAIREVIAYNQGVREEQESRQLGEQINREPVHHTTAAAQKRRLSRIQLMTRGYLDAMQWAETDDEGGSLEAYDLAMATRDKAQDICATFYDKHHVDLGAYVDRHGYSDRASYDAWECAGHDLWLTSGGHGVGFWDRGMGGIGARLSADCGYGGTFKQRDAYVGDDNLIYLDN